ncbi:hypothetical protein NMH_1813 [Neisseria meningitidis H44/76]|uniref:Uncharacterized protein n=4 Tax=Neisseria meningitidis TaxID=487 RepID=A0A0H5QS03_NEIMI|nr:hypothetical protein HMPREF0602_0733 [Neisseria meningitidis ATCC 13091]EFV63162.1 hypothetical protein NMH_1813 [Neisseria meningitidis H44/76]KER39433.1 hypothetical protein F528_1595 [Neisseria meningitidis 992008]CBA05011.1 hypothetical protein predicted by Glimmer/Critica [Neisseria meningitidis alpha275]CRY98442.1 hypothetical protein [Neisseria meningitidis serogroup B]
MLLIAVLLGIMHRFSKQIKGNCRQYRAAVKINRNIFNRIDEKSKKFR